MESLILDVTGFNSISELAEEIRKSIDNDHRQFEAVSAKKKNDNDGDLSYYKSKEFNVFEVINFLKSNDGFIAIDSDGTEYAYDQLGGLYRRNGLESRISLTEKIMLKKFWLCEEVDLLKEKTTPMQVVTLAMSGSTKSFKGIDKKTEQAKMYTVKDINNMTVRELISLDWYK